MSELRNAFFEDLARAEDRATDAAIACLREANGPEWSEDKEAFRLLRERLTSEDDIAAFGKVVHEFVHVALHTVLVSIDGGSASAEVGRLRLVNEAGESVGDGLHDAFVAYLLETGRID